LGAGYTSPADVKELIPEFFCLPEFLVSGRGLPAMTTTDGKDISAVNTGNWCRNNHDFVHKMRHFLQADAVSLGLPSWLDLLFGFKSRGEPAVDAKNVFHPLCYVQEDEQTQSEDELMRAAAVTGVINFGQCCNQAFKAPHPPPVRRFLKDHIMADPTLLIHQRLNPAGIPFPVADIRFRGSSIAAVSRLALLLPSGEVAVEGNCVCAHALPLIEGESYPPRVRGLPRFANLKKVPAKI
jgi:hypothetical protein